MRRPRFITGGSSTSGTLSTIGSVPNACHSLCTTLVSLLATFGITLGILPLMFLMTYQRQIWWIALAFFLLAAWFYLKGARRTRDRKFLALNGGLLVSGLPFGFTASLMGWLRPIGLGLALLALVMLFLGQERTGAAPAVQRNFSWKSVALSALILVLAYNQWLLYGLSAPAEASTMGTETSRMSLTPFDVALANELMDKNGDGLCDSCGMPVEQCIDSGQLECSMHGGSGAIGILGSQHIHADFKVYINGQSVDFSDMDHMGRMRANLPVSSFIHVDSGAPAPEKAGDILHMHAANVPLWIFFTSLGGALGDDSLTLPDGSTFTNSPGLTLKLYVNGERSSSIKNFVYKDGDKILISFGPENDPEVPKQMNTITNFANDH